jgi:nucleotide-binding universal stress UspA family protein
MKSILVQTRIQLRNILYCTDLSETASRALPYAAALARHFGSTVYALHVRPIVQPATVPPLGAPVAMELTKEQFREHIEDRLSGCSGVRNTVPQLSL